MPLVQPYKAKTNKQISEKERKNNVLNHGMLTLGVIQSNFTRELILTHITTCVYQFPHL